MTLLIALGWALIVAGCQSMADVKPRDGKKAVITGRPYAEVWGAALKVANEHFKIRQQDQARGVILAERTYHLMRPGSWVGIYITPPAPAAGPYTVEVVMRTKSIGDVVEQGWESKVLRDVQDVLAGRPMQ